MLPNLFRDLVLPTDFPDLDVAFRLLQNFDEFLFVEFLHGQGLLPDTLTHLMVKMYWGRSNGLS